MNYGQISVGSSGISTCALYATKGNVYCWGWFYYGGSVLDPETIVKPTLIGAPPGITFLTVSRGAYHACAIANDHGTFGSTYCWGDNDQGQLGDGTTVVKMSANLVTMPTYDGIHVKPFIVVSPGVYGTCGMSYDGRPYCWGKNTLGSVGDGTGIDRTTPVMVAMPHDPDSMLSNATVTFASLSENGSAHFCGLDSSGRAYCWGANNYGQLVDGTTINRLSPVPVTMPSGVRFAKITVGLAHTCAMTTGTTDKQIYCWGWNGSGQLGDGGTTNQLVPELITNPATNLLGVYAGYQHTCANFQSGAFCWGKNTYGQFGDGTTTSSNLPVAVALPGSANFASMSLGVKHSCAVTTSGIAYCWGDNRLGELGDNTLVSKTTPVLVVQPDGSLP